MQAVNIKEHGVEVLDLLRTLGNQLPLEAEELSKLGGHGVCHAGVDIHRDFLDPVRGLLSNLLDVYTTIRTGKNERNSSQLFRNNSRQESYLATMTGPLLSLSMAMQK